MAIFLIEELFGCGQWAKPEAALGSLWLSLRLAQCLDFLVAQCSIVDPQVGHLERPVGIAALIDLSDGARQPRLAIEAACIIRIAPRLPANPIDP